MVGGFKTLCLPKTEIVKKSKPEDDEQEYDGYD
jgi:hypothetical protein